MLLGLLASVSEDSFDALASSRPTGVYEVTIWHQSCTINWIIAIVKATVSYMDKFVGTRITKSSLRTTHPGPIRSDDQS